MQRCQSSSPGSTINIESTTPHEILIVQENNPYEIRLEHNKCATDKERYFRYYYHQKGFYMSIILVNDNCKLPINTTFANLTRDPVLIAQGQNPSPRRIKFDAQATNNDRNYPPNVLFNTMFEPMDNGLRAAIEPVLNHAYQQSDTFCRLYNYWAKPEQTRYTAERGSMFWVSSTPDEISVHGKRLELALHAQNDSLLPVTMPEAAYSTHHNVMSGDRALIQQLVRIMTGLRDLYADDNRRGPIVEWVNLIQFERGKQEPYQIAHFPALIVSQEAIMEKNNLDRLLSQLITTADNEEININIKKVYDFMLHESSFTQQPYDELAENYFKLINKYESHYPFRPKVICKNHIILGKSVLRGMAAMAKSEHLLFRAMQGNPYFKNLPRKNIWKLSIDGNRQQHSKAAFEMESGYLAKMNNAWQFAIENLDRKITSDFLLELNKICVDGTCRYDDTGTARFRMNGFRTQRTMFGLDNSTATASGLAERRLLAAKHKFLSLVWSDDDQGIKFKNINHKEYNEIEMKTFIDDFLKSYYKNIVSAPKEKIKPEIIRLCLSLEWLHPFDDGNIRTIVIILHNLLRMQNRLPPVILEDPNRFDGYSLQELVAEVDKGERTFQGLLTN